MITEKQRRRALARAKWERQQSRRTAAEKRARTWSIIGGSVATVVVLVLVGWGVQHLLSDDSNLPSQPAITFKTPTNPSFATSYDPPSTTGTTMTGKSTGTTPATTGTTGTTRTTGKTGR